MDSPVAIWQKTLIKSILKDGPHQSLLEVNIIAIEVDMILSNFFKRPNLILICLHMVDYLEISDHTLRSNLLLQIKCKNLKSPWPNNILISWLLFAKSIFLSSIIPMKFDLSNGLLVWGIFPSFLFWKTWVNSSKLAQRPK